MISEKELLKRNNEIVDELSELEKEEIFGFDDMDNEELYLYYNRVHKKKKELISHVINVEDYLGMIQLYRDKLHEMYSSIHAELSERVSEETKKENEKSSR